MKQEEKDLLLKDLCGRLPYGVKGKVYAEVTNGNYDITGDMIFFDSPFDVILDEINITTEEIHVDAIGNEDTVDFIEMQQADGEPYTIDEFKPYLRPLSSMTEKQFISFKKNSEYEYRESYEVRANNGNKIEIIQTDCDAWTKDETWLNEHHFDYRGLIEKGFAIEAPEGMYEF